jgi:CspA family cold shock protein
MPEKKIGYVKWFDIGKGYRFISPEDKEVKEDIFVHFSSIMMNGFKKLDPGDKVEFEIISGEKGLEASNVKILVKDKRY